MQLFTHERVPRGFRATRPAHKPVDAVTKAICGCHGMPPKAKGTNRCPTWLKFSQESSVRFYPNEVSR